MCPPRRTARGRERDRLVQKIGWSVRPAKPGRTPFGVWSRRAGGVRSRAISFVNAYDPFKIRCMHYAALTCGDPRPHAYSPLTRPRVPSRAHPHNPDGKQTAYFSVFSRRRRMVERTVTAAEVLSTYAPPALIFLQLEHAQMPTATRRGVLAAEVAEKLRVLGHLLLLHHLAEGSTVTGAVLADDPWESRGWGGCARQRRIRRRRFGAARGTRRSGRWAKPPREGGGKP